MNNFILDAQQFLGETYFGFDFGLFSIKSTIGVWFILAGLVGLIIISIIKWKISKK
jgi:hypothetical protein